jgi:hypothetical protein
VAQSAGRRRERPPVDVRVVDGRVIAHRQSGPPLRCMGLRATGSVAGGVVRGRVDDGACRLGDASVESIQAAGQVRVGRGRPVVRAYVSRRRPTTGRV